MSVTLQGLLLGFYTECDKTGDTDCILITLNVQAERKIWLHQNIHKFRKISIDTLENNDLQVTSMISSTFFHCSVV
jgi:hypothetical protein